MSNKVVIFSAPSGSGKSTVVNHLLKSHPEFEFSISATSRTPRGSEKDGIEYHFLTADEFRRRIVLGEFVEFEEVYKDRFYGTLKSEVERIWSKGHVIIFDVDVKGGAHLKEYFGDKALSVLIIPPSMEILEQRLRGRGTDNDEEIEMRLAKAQSELDFAHGRFDSEIINDKLDDTLRTAELAFSAFLEK